MSGPPSPSFHRAHHRSNPYRSRPSASYYANNPLFDMYTPYWRYTRSIFSTYAPEESSIRGSTAYDYGRSDGDGGRYWRARSPETAAQADAEHPRYLTLAEEFNGILTYINPTVSPPTSFPCYPIMVHPCPYMDRPIITMHSAAPSHQRHHRHFCPPFHGSCTEPAYQRQSSSTQPAHLRQLL